MSIQPTFLVLEVPLLDEATEGSKAAAGADHDDGCAGDEAMEGSLWDSN